MIGLMWKTCWVVLAVAIGPTAEETAAPSPTVSETAVSDPAAEQQRRKKEEQIHEALDEPVSVAFRDTPLRQALEDLHLLSGIPICLDKHDLQEADIDPETPVSLRVRNIALKAAINLLVKQANLTYTVSDEGVRVVNEQVRRDILEQREYLVGDLVKWPGLALDQNTKASAMAGCQTAPAGRTYEPELIKLIVTSVAPESWLDKGGKGTIQYYPLGQNLIVYQSQKAQAEVADLLESLRRLLEPGPTTVSLTLKLIEVGPDGKEKVVWSPEMRGTFGTPMSVSTSQSLSVPNGSIRDLLNLPSTPAGSTAADEQLSIGLSLVAGAKRLPNDCLRVNVQIEQSDIEQADRTGILVAGTTYHLVRTVKPGQTVKTTLQRDDAGAPRRWLEVTVQPGSQ
jgi:hypothetical protein